ncbi:hypothetical protein Tco_0988508 [Tanacetum coccineum]|uniref:Uncharacterized protein n=1 Tax=Tanacetum coccineum TaxID=301880 RepID=A0ABQ5ERH5_9ASTR
MEDIKIRHQESSEQDPRTQERTTILDLYRLQFSRIPPLDMPPKRTSTSAAPAITLDAIRQLVADSVAIALKAQAANLANTDNTNKNTRTSGTPVARKGINDHKRKIEDRGNTTTNNNYPKHNNNNHSQTT